MISQVSSAPVNSGVRFLRYAKELLELNFVGGLLCWQSVANHDLVGCVQKRRRHDRRRAVYLVIPFAVLLFLGLYAPMQRSGVSSRILSSVVIIVGAFGCALPY
jgi:hypothetical protein